MLAFPSKKNKTNANPKINILRMFIFGLGFVLFYDCHDQMIP